MSSFKEATMHTREITQEYSARFNNGELSRSHEFDYLSKAIEFVNLQAEHLENRSLLIAQEAEDLLNSVRAQQ